MVIELIQFWDRDRQGMPIVKDVIFSNSLCEMSPTHFIMSNAYTTARAAK